MCPSSFTPAEPLPPDLSQHFERIITDRHLKAGRALAGAMGLQRGSSVLDLGCGTGLLSAQLADMVGMQGDVLGLDPSPYHMSIAHQRSRLNLRFQVGSPFEMGRFPVGCFDAIVVNDVIHAWPDPIVPLRELHRVLKPGGRVGLATPCKDHPGPVALVLSAVLAQAPFSAWPWPAEAQGRGLNAHALEALLRDAGFADVSIEQQPDVMVHATPNAAIEFANACTWGQLLRHLPEQPQDLRAQARAALHVGLERLRTSEGIAHRGVRLLAVASKAV